MTGASFTLICKSEKPEYENVGFSAKSIDHLQRMSISEPMAQAATEHLQRHRRIAWDDARALFWVNHPHHGWQVAVWMMPIAEKFDPQAAA